jgi:hypothetical protein
MCNTAGSRVVSILHRWVGIPVVHEDIRLPYPVGRYPEVLDASVLGGVPPQVHVIPFLTTSNSE